MRKNKVVTAIAVVLAANFVTGSLAHGEEDKNTRSFDEIMQELSKRIEESASVLEGKLNKYSDKLMNMKPTDLGFSDDKMYPENELTRDVREIQFPADSITQIKFSKRIGKDDIRVIKSQDNNVTILVTVLADPEHKQLVASLANSLNLNIEGQRALVSERNQSYRCITSTINGSLKLKGACYRAITVAIPENSSISIYNDSKRIHGPIQPMSVKELIDGLDDSFKTDRAKKIEAFKNSASPGTKLNAKEMEEILEKFSFDDEKVEALSALVSFLDPAEKETFSERISDIFSFSSNQKKAFQILLRAR